MQQIFTEKVETHQELFDEMLNRFNISARDLAVAAGISEVMVSRFRRGKADLGTAKFLALVAVIPEDAKSWYVGQLIGIKPKVNLLSCIASAPVEEQAEALVLLASKFASANHKTTGLVSLPQAV